MKTVLSKRSYLPWLMCGMGMLFYFYNFFLRVSPSAMSTEIIQQLHISLSQFGSLAAFYYFAYTPMQIPAGILYDKFGVRSMQLFAISISVLGLCIFINAQHYGLSCLGRFLIGFGCAFAYIGVMKTAANWLPPHRFALVAGMTTTFGMAAAIFADMGLTNMVKHVGYQHALIVGVVMGVALMIIIVLFMRNQPQDDTEHGVHHQPATLTFKAVLSGFGTMLRSKQMWLIGIIGCLTYLPSTVFLDLWGIPYLKAAYHLDASQAATIISYTFIGWIVGGPLVGWLSDRMQSRRWPLFICYGIAAMLFVVMFTSSMLSLALLKSILFFIGVCCGSHPISIAIGKENNPLALAGVAVAFSNCLTMVGGMVFQPLVGKIMDMPLSISLATHFTYALSIIPLGLIIALALLTRVKETYFTQVSTNCTMVSAMNVKSGL